MEARIAVMNNPRYVSESSDGGLFLLDRKTGLELFDTRNCRNGITLRHGGEVPAQVARSIFSSDGRVIVALYANGRITLWEAASGQELLSFAADKQPLDPPVADEWTALADSGKTAFPAMARLVAGGDQSVALLREKLTGSAKPDPARTARLIAELDHADGSVRETAADTLRKLGPEVEADLRAALQSRADNEQARGRLSALLADLEGTPVSSPRLLRLIRLCAVLERIGSPEACELLRSLSGGKQGSRAAQEAQGALMRISFRTSP